MLYQSAQLRLESADRIATIWLDAPVATRGLIQELGRAIDIVRQSPFLDVLVIRGDGEIFLTGPDLDEIDALSDGETVRGFAMVGQALLSRLEALSENTLTVAYIDGRCAGAGLELALACDYRLAVAKPEGLIGCDALGRGVFPCWGLTQRLPRLIGVAAALDLMLSERPIPARGARALGLVDHAFGPRPAKTELWSFVADLQDRPRSPDRAKGKRGLWSRLRESPPFVRRTAIRPYREAFRRPDEQALIRAVERGWFSGKAQGEAAERAAFLAFANNPGCRERRDHARRAEAFADDCRNAPRPRRWGIVGMGPAAIELGLLLLRSGYAVSFAEPNAGVREIGTRQFDLGLQQCVSGGWLNVVEAGQKRKAVAVLADEWQLNSADVLVSAGSPLDSWAVRCRPGPHSDSPKRVVTLRFDGLPLAAQTVEIRSDEGAADFAAGLAAAVTLCGKRVVRPVESRALEFAA